MLLALKTLPAVTTSPINTNVAAIPAGYQFVTSVIIYADSGNTGNVFVGDTDNSNTAGIPIAPGANLVLSVDESRGRAEKIDATSIFVRSATITNTVRVVALVGI